MKSCTRHSGPHPCPKCRRHAAALAGVGLTPDGDRAPAPTLSPAYAERRPAAPRDATTPCLDLSATPNAPNGRKTACGEVGG